MRKCHDKQVKQAEGAKSVHAAFADGECSKCHNPHRRS